MATFKLTLEYEGTAYAGWQRQPDRPTIQAAVEAALEQIVSTRIPVIAAGRTDAGVHALGQVASFRSEQGMTALEWTRALNAVLPPDIAVVSTVHVADDFHARYSARSKLYRYRILNRRERSAFERHRAWHVWGNLDIGAMRAAAAYLLGCHDFSSFEGPRAETGSPMCHVHRLDIAVAGSLISIDAEADRFLKQMVRAIVGTLVEAGHGKRRPEELQTILHARDRRAAGRTAPPHGLYLVHVGY